MEDETSKERRKIASKLRYLANKTKYTERSKAWALANPDRMRQLKTKWIDKNREHQKQQHVEYRRKNRSRCKEWAATGYLRRRYGLTPVQVEQLLVRCEHKCTGCLTPFSLTRRACIDHDHLTGFVRGLLCDHCNQALGLVKDDPIVLTQLASYLDKTITHNFGYVPSSQS
jgi:hypothetical protein